MKDGLGAGRCKPLAVKSCALERTDGPATEAKDGIWRLTRLAHISGMGTDIPPYVLESLTLVGSGKAIGYLPLRTVEHVLGLNIEDVIANAAARGLRAIRIGPRQSCIKSGALYVFDPDALERLLQGSLAILAEAGAPTTPERFVRFIARDWFAPDHPIMPIIRDAFADSSEAANAAASLSRGKL